MSINTSNAKASIPLVWDITEGIFTFQSAVASGAFNPHDIGTAVPISIAMSYMLNTSNHETPMLSQVDSADAIATGNEYLAAVAIGLAYNGTSYDRVRTNSAANISASTQQFNIGVAQPGEWSIAHTPAANTRATITKAAGAAGVRHVCRSIAFSLLDFAASTIGGAGLQVVLRDGATGVGTIIWAMSVGSVSIGPDSLFEGFTGLNIVGSAATAMTLEFTAGPGATNFESVALTGYDTE